MFSVRPVKRSFVLSAIKGKEHVLVIFGGKKSTNVYSSHKILINKPPRTLARGQQEGVAKTHRKKGGKNGKVYRFW